MSRQIQGRFKESGAVFGILVVVFYPLILRNAKSMTVWKYSSYKSKSYKWMCCSSGCCVPTLFSRSLESFLVAKKHFWNSSDNRCSRV